MADDDHDWLGLERCGGANRARDHRFSAKFVQDLGPLRTHPGPFARSENDCGNAHDRSRLFVVIEVRDFPRIGGLARRDQQVAIEGATVGHVDGRAKQELDMVGAVALGSEFVMHDGLVSIGVDFLAADQLYLVMKLVECEAGTEWLGRLQIDRYIVLVDEAIGDAARAVGRMASGGNDRSERRDEKKLGAAVTKEESAGAS